MLGAVVPATRHYDSCAISTVTVDPIARRTCVRYRRRPE